MQSELSAWKDLRTHAERSVAALLPARAVVAKEITELTLELENEQVRVCELIELLEEQQYRVNGFTDLLHHYEERLKRYDCLIAQYQKIATSTDICTYAPIPLRSQQARAVVNNRRPRAKSAPVASVAEPRPWGKAAPAAVLPKAPPPPAALANAPAAALQKVPPPPPPPPPPAAQRSG